MRTITVVDKKAEGGPTRVQMYDIDAQHAVEADPERYVIEQPEPVRGPVTIEDRVAALERRMDKVDPPPTPEELKPLSEYEADGEYDAGDADPPRTEPEWGRPQVEGPQK